MSTTIAKNLMAEMKLLGMLGACDKALNQSFSRRDRKDFAVGRYE